MAGTGRDETRPATSSAPPDQDVGKVVDKDRERRRLAEALRANLERRKKQKRARHDREAGAEDR
jgi:hypothetical protein